MKKNLLILIGSAALLAGCASAQQNCVLLKFPHAPSAAMIERLADTQPAADRQQIRDWFAQGETGFILASTHTNEINAAIAAGAKAKTIR